MFLMALCMWGRAEIVLCLQVEFRCLELFVASCLWKSAQAMPSSGGKIVFCIQAKFQYLVFHIPFCMREFAKIAVLQGLHPVMFALFPLPRDPCCVVPVEVTSWGGSSVSTLMTLLTESGEDTPLESLSMSSVSGLNNSRDSNLGRGRARGSGRPRTTAVDRRTSGNGFLIAGAPAIRPAGTSLRHMKPDICYSASNVV
jgi:hypothetical protein